MWINRKAKGKAVPLHTIEAYGRVEV